MGNSRREPEEFWRKILLAQWLMACGLAAGRAENGNITNALGEEVVCVGFGRRH